MHRPNDPAGPGSVRRVARLAPLLLALFLTGLPALGSRAVAQGETLPAAMFRGNAAHTGEQPGPGPKGAPALRWAFATGDHIRSSPAVVDGTVYFGSSDKFLYAVDAATGGERWRFMTRGAVVSSPAVAAGIVYAGSQDGYLYAIDAATGEQRWRFRAGMANPPTVVDGLVLVSGAAHMLYALDAASGLERWHFQTLAPVLTAPTVAGQSVLVGTSDGSLFSLAKSTGEERWSRTSGAIVLTAPAIAAGVAVFVASGVQVGEQNEERITVALDEENEEIVIDDDTVVGETIPGISLVAVDAETGELRWNRLLDTEQFETAQVGELAVPVAPPAIAGGLAYVGTESGQIQAFDLFTGIQRWGAFLDAPVLAAPAIAGGVLYVGTYGNALAAIDAATGAPVWSFPTQHRIHSSAAVVDGTVYVGADDGYLYAIGGS